jgi:hypothetical protein
MDPQEKIGAQSAQEHSRNPRAESAEGVAGAGEESYEALLEAFLSRVEAEGSTVMEEGEARVGAVAESLGLSEKELEDAQEAFGLKVKMQSIKEEADQIAEDARGEVGVDDGAEEGVAEEDGSEVEYEHRIEQLQDGYKELLRDAEGLAESAGRLTSWIKTRAPYGGFNIGDKIADSDQYRSLQAVGPLLEEGVREYRRSVPDKIHSEKAAAEFEQAIVRLSSILDEHQRVSQRVARAVESLDNWLLQTGKQIDEYHDGAYNDDSEFIRSLFPLLKDVYEDSQSFQGVVQRLGDNLVTLQKTN